MASGEKNVVTCVEFGTHAVRVLHGMKDRDGSIEILGFGQAPSGDAVRKGEIVQSRAAAAALDKALAEADRTSGNIRARHTVYCIVNGPSVTGVQCKGTASIGADRKVRKNHVESAVQKAINSFSGQEQTVLNYFDSFFLLDSHTQVQDPEGESASRLTACLHVISVREQVRKSMNDLLRDRGFEEKINYVSAGIASVYGVLQEKEKNDGVLLINLGSGVTSYTAVRRDGILASGVLGVGVDNIANDLSIGLELPMDLCRRMLQDGSDLFSRIGRGDAFLETDGPLAGTKRKIPLGSAETIVSCRLQEIFSILREILEQNGCLHQMESGIVLCGGGALVPTVRQLLSSSMRLPVRLGNPPDSGNIPEELSPPVCYASLLGLLRYALDEGDRTASSVKKVGDVLEGFGDQMIRKVKDLMGAFKI